MSKYIDVNGAQGMHALNLDGTAGKERASQVSYSNSWTLKTTKAGSVAVLSELGYFRNKYNIGCLSRLGENKGWNKE